MKNSFLFTLIILTAIVTCSVVFKPLISSGELPGGRWIHHERQAPIDDITAIFKGDHYKLWVSTKYSLHAFDGTYWKKHTYSDQNLRDHTPFYHDEKGRFFFEDGGKLIVLDDGIITRYADEEIRFPVIGAPGGEGIVYLGQYDITTGGVYVFDGASVKKIRGGRVRSIAADKEGRIWATILDTGMESIGLMMMENDSWTDLTDEIDSILPSKTNELTVQVAPNGDVWVNNLGKYGVFSDGEWTFHTPGLTGCQGSGPVFLSFDSSGGVWGYRVKKLYRLSRPKLTDGSGDWEQFFTMENSVSTMPNFLAEDSDGAVWIFNSHNILVLMEMGIEYDGGSSVVFENNLDLASDRVTCMVYTEDGKLMCGHGVRSEQVAEREDDGISVWDGSGWSNFNMADDTYLYNVYILKRSPDDDIIAHTDHGLKIFDGNAWSSIDTLRAVDVADIAWDEQAVMWIASYAGLFEYNDPYIEFKVNPEWLFPHKVFYNLNFDPEGILYMQSNYGVIVSYYEDRDEIWVAHPSHTLYGMDIAVDGDGVLWCARMFNLSWWDQFYGWQDVTELYGGRMVEIDENGRIWASGYKTTGYVEDGVWHSIPVLSQYASDEFVFDGQGRYALNVFDVDMDADPPERTEFYGIFEFVPGETFVDYGEKPEPVITAENFPNPFNPLTTITFSIPEPGIVTIAVYNLSGQKVRTLASGRFPAGQNRVIWDSLTDDGNLASSGVYIYRIVAGEAVKTGKMLLLR